MYVCVWIFLVKFCADIVNGIEPQKKNTQMCNQETVVYFFCWKQVKTVDANLIWCKKKKLWRSSHSLSIVHILIFHSQLHNDFQHRFVLCVSCVMIQISLEIIGIKTFQWIFSDQMIAQLRVPVSICVYEVSCEGVMNMCDSIAFYKFFFSIFFQLKFI